MNKIHDVVASLGLRLLSEDFEVPDKGVLSSNLILMTTAGKVMLRMYPEDLWKLETGNCFFEAHALDILKKKGFNVPKLFAFDDNTLVKKFDDVNFIACEILPGKTLCLSDIAISEIEKIGVFLSEFLKHSVSVDIVEGTDIPNGDQQYIRYIVEYTAERSPNFSKDNVLNEMMKICLDADLKLYLTNSPQGIVHADIFDENMLFDGCKYYLIDFGDSFYGAVVHDLAISSMEFCILDGKWRMDALLSFLRPFSEWIKANELSFELFVKILRLNCIRFFGYTLRLSLFSSNYNTHTKNPFYLRFVELSENGELIKKLHSTLVGPLF